jgi:futalosine hydrolase
MKLLIVAATQQEILPFLQSQHLRRVDVLITGVGVAATTHQLTKHLHHDHYDLVLQAGVAGTYNPVQYPLGSVVLVSKDCFADRGAYHQHAFESLADLDLSSELDWLHNPHQLLARLALPKVRAATVNTITSDQLYLDAIIKKYAPDIESMEGAALHYVCQHLHKPYLQLRSISNAVGERNKQYWQLHTAIDNLNAALADVVNRVLG